MLQFVNAFSCALNEENGTVVIHFNQTEPHVIEDENGQTSIETVTNNVVSLVMSADTIANFIKTMGNVGKSPSVPENNDTTN